MIYTAQTKRAISLCIEAHDGQVGKDGLPYFLHPLHLAEQMEDEVTTIVALLHDVIEDTAITIEDLKAQEFPAVVYEALELLTRKKGTPYLDYIKSLAENPIARKVKLVDLRHNSDMSRLDNPTDGDFKRLEKYEKAIQILENKNGYLW